MSPSTKRRLLLTLLALPAACAVLTNGDGWEAHPDSPPLPAFYVDATSAQIQRMCPQVRNAEGCAVRRYDLGKCFIYLEPNAPKWLATHEALHCAGFSHA